MDEFIVQQLSDMSDEDSERFKVILEIKIEEVPEQFSTTQEYSLLKKKREKLQMDIVTQTKNMREVDESICCYLQDDIQTMSEGLHKQSVCCSNWKKAETIARLLFEIWNRQKEACSPLQSTQKRAGEGSDYIDSDYCRKNLYR